MKIFIILVSILTCLISCTNEKRQKVIYPKEGEVENKELKKDSTLIEIADLPIHIDSTKFLIYPIGKYKLYNGLSSSNSSLKFSRYNEFGSFNISRYRDYEITGELKNLKFEGVNSGDTKMLTNKNILIESVTFLNETFKKTKKQYLVYKVIDKDTNRDNRLNNFDISTLYISNFDGSNFTKLTGEFHELIDWNIILIKNKLYFRSAEDTNKNGHFDKLDKILYQFIELSDDEWKVNKYNPI